MPASETAQHFFLLWRYLKLGFLASSAFCGIVCIFLLFEISDENVIIFIRAYCYTYNTLFVSSLIFGTGLFVFFTQKTIPDIIETAFYKNSLKKTKYEIKKARYQSVACTIMHSSFYMVICFIILTLCKFPLPKEIDAFMTVAICMQYGVAVYVGRKIYNISAMINAAKSARLKIKSKHLLWRVIEYVNITTTLTILFLYFHIESLSGDHFEFSSYIGDASKNLLFFLLFIATPVLVIYNYYPRAIIRKILIESIDTQLKLLERCIQKK